MLFVRMFLYLHRTIDLNFYIKAKCKFYIAILILITYGQQAAPYKYTCN